MNAADRTISEFLKDAPPEVRRWITTNFVAFRLDGFDRLGNNVELFYGEGTMQTYALTESLRRSLQHLDDRSAARTAYRAADELEQQEGDHDEQDDEGQQGAGA